MMLRSKLRVCLALALAYLAPLPARSQEPRRSESPIRYEIAFPNRAHHEAQVTVRVTDLPSGPLNFRISRSSPGRYAPHEFAKNVYAVRVTDPRGRSLAIIRPDPRQWTVEDHDGEVVFTYTLFADRADGTYSGIDRTHAHLNIPATFVWASGLENRPVEVRFTIPEESGWRVATQLQPTPDPEVFSAPDLAYFMDSPVELSDFELREWRVAAPTGPQRIRVAVHHRDSRAALKRYAAGVRAVTAEQAGVFGEYPTFDYDTYMFIACYLPWVAGDGMEHRNSTILTSTGSLESDAVALLGTVAHEFFHAWNMERIRATALEPFDFEDTVMSAELWFGEGFTSYYDDLTMVRAGLIPFREFASRMGRLVHAVVNGAGREIASPVEMSRQASFMDAAASVDPTNRANTFISYYSWGALLGLALDLTLRSGESGATLDGFMRALWQRHGRSEVPYTMGDLEHVLSELSGDAGMARGFFERYVYGREVPDMVALLARAGVRVNPVDPRKPILTHAQLVPTIGGLRVASSTVRGDPLYEAGVDRGDLLTRIAGQAMDVAGGLERVLDRVRTGDTVEVVWESRGETYRARATVQGDPTLTATPEELLSGARYLGVAERAFRERWLRSLAGEVSR